MRLLTPEQQALSPAGQEIGRHAPKDNGEPFDLASTLLQQFVNHATITDWREAVALGCVHRSRYGEWEPFRKLSGTEKWISCQFGTAWASDGVHIIIHTVQQKWISRSAQVVIFRVQTPYAGIRQVKATDYLQPRKKTTRESSLMAEYASL